MPVTESKAGENAIIRDKSINYIKENWGLLDDLPSVFIPVIWVTVYRAIEHGLRFENGGIPRNSSDIFDYVNNTHELQMTMAKLRFLNTIISQLRDEKDHEKRLAACYLFIDILRWNILDAAELGKFARLRKRLSAKGDPLYNYPIPSGIWCRT